MFTPFCGKFILETVYQVLSQLSEFYSNIWSLFYRHSVYILANVKTLDYKVIILSK